MQTSSCKKLGATSATTEDVEAVMLGSTVVCRKDLREVVADGKKIAPMAG